MWAGVQSLGYLLYGCMVTVDHLLYILKVFAF